MADVVRRTEFRRVMINRSGTLPMQFDLPLGRTPAEVRRRVELLERILERSFVIPGINRPVGLDAILGLVPGAGDAIGAVLGLFIVWEARNLGLSRWKIARMLGNIAFDAAIGVVPIVGDVLDFLFRSNSLNLKIVLNHLDRHYPETRILEQ